MTNNATAIQLQKFKTTDQLLHKRGPSAYSAGINDRDKGYIKYAPPSSKNPILSIINPIADDDRNIIMPGYYELVLSADRQMLVMAQAGNVIATMPVFRLEEDKSQEKLAQPMDNKSQRKADREKAKAEKKHKKLVQEGKIDDEPQIYTNATIDYDKEGDYYLIKYERGSIRAWGAIK